MSGSQASDRVCAEAGHARSHAPPPRPPAGRLRLQAEPSTSGLRPLRLPASATAARPGLSERAPACGQLPPGVHPRGEAAGSASVRGLTSFCAAQTTFKPAVPPTLLPSPPGHTEQTAAGEAWGRRRCLGDCRLGQTRFQTRMCSQRAPETEASAERGRCFPGPARTPPTHTHTRRQRAPPLGLSSCPHLWDLRMGRRAGHSAQHKAPRAYFKWTECRVPTTFYPRVVVAGGAFGRRSGWEGRACARGIRDLRKQTPGLLDPSATWGHSEKPKRRPLESRPSPDTEPAGAETMGLQPPGLERQASHKPPRWSQPNWTKTPKQLNQEESMDLSGTAGMTKLFLTLALLIGDTQHSELAWSEANTQEKGVRRNGCRSPGDTGRLQGPSVPGCCGRTPAQRGNRDFLSA